MTIAQIKADLPDVYVRVGGLLRLGRVRGRLNQFATVHVIDGPSEQFSWEAIERAVNNDQVLNFGY